MEMFRENKTLTLSLSLTVFLDLENMLLSLPSNLSLVLVN